MNAEIQEIMINGEAYVRKSDAPSMANTLNGMRYVIVRTTSAGVFAGYVESKDGRAVVLREARRLWYWKGAASLSQLAMEGVKCPNECKFPVAMDRVELLESIEIIDVTKAAQTSIGSVPSWKQ